MTRTSFNKLATRPPFYEVALHTSVLWVGNEDTDLHFACKKGDLNRLRHILSKSLVDLNRRGQCGRTPVMMAAEEGHRQVFDLLVKEGADVSLMDDNRHNILHVACLGGHVDMVKNVLSRKVADINSRGKYGRTPLMVAAENGHRQVFDLLVREGDDVSLEDDDGDNILHVACLGGHVDMVKYVLSLKVADINSRGHYGMTPLMVAAVNGHRQVFDLLVTRGAGVSLVDDGRNNILHVACLGGHVDMVKYVLSQKVTDINSRGPYGRTPLMVAAVNGHRQVFDLLVTQGADVSLEDDGRNNILHVACLGGHVDMVKYVLSQKTADINSRGQYGRTLLMLAVSAGHRQVFDLLVREGADVSLEDDDGDNILHMACLGGHVHMVKYVLTQKVAFINGRGQHGRTPMMIAAENGHRQVFDLLVTEGADVYLLDSDGDNILHVACLGGHVDMVKYVLSQKIADINSRGQYGETPLMKAAEKGHRQVFNLLVTRGAGKSLVDDGRNSILHVACLGGHVDIVKYVLLQKVTDINSRGQYGRTPLMVAAVKGHRQVFDLLVTHGADVTLVDDGRNNILHVACLGGYVDMVKYVLSQKTADINSRGQYGETPLMKAAEKGHRQVFDLLVTRGVVVSLVDELRNSILHVACLGGHVDIVKYVLSQKVTDINSRGQYGRTPLIVAAMKGHRQVFDLLVTEGADVTLVDDGRSNILHVACLGGHVDMVKHVLSQKVTDINSRGQYGRTPLMVAAVNGHRQVFDLLVTQGADVTLVDGGRNNILHVACLGGHVDMVKYVLSQKIAEINSRGKHGRTPLMVAAEKGHRQVFDLLVTRGAGVSLVDQLRNNILHVACLGGHVDMVKYVLSQKVTDINSRGRYGRTPVMVAAEKGHRQVFDLLVTQGADVTLVDDGRNNILHVACLGGYVDMIKYVLSQKTVDINSRGEYGEIPLMKAAEKGHRQVFGLLVTEGADVYLVDSDGDNILHVACVAGHVDMVKYVLSQKIVDINSRGKHGRTPLMVAAVKGHRQVFDLLVTQGADVTLVDDGRNNILHVACLGGYVDMVKYVLSQKTAEINSRGRYGETPLMKAAEKGHRQVFDLLVTRGAGVSLVDELRNSILHVACLGGHVDIVKYVLSQKTADINSRGQYGRTPLMVAAVNGHRQVFGLLVTQGADVTLVDDGRSNILHVACLGGHVDMVKHVLSQKVTDINSRGQYVRTPLMVAAVNGHRQVFDLLVTQGADVTLVDDGRNNILHVACLGGHVDMVKYVLSQKVADINSKGQLGETPLMVAAEKGHRQVFDLLVTRGAGVSLVDQLRNNILHVACLGGHVDMVKYVLSQKVTDINSRGRYGRTPVMVAAEKGHRQVFDLLVTQGADVSLVDDGRNNILHVTCLGGHVDMVKYVLSQKIADINSRGQHGRTPLMVAAENGHRQVFDLLVTQGADIYLVDSDGDNNLHVACVGGHVDMVKYVLSQKVADINSRGKHGRTPVMVAAENGHRQVFDLLVTRGAGVSLVDELRNSILHVACLGGHVDIVKYVLSQKVADINSRGQYGETPLMKAAEKGHRQVFDLLVTRGAGVSLVDELRNSILHVACLGGHVDIVKYVLSQNVADINSRGRYGRTPLMVAAENGHRQVFDLLVREGADVTLVDDGRNNILHVACLGGHVDVVKYVLSQKVTDINSRRQYGRTPLMVAAVKGHRQVFDLLVTQGADVTLVDDGRNNILHVACLGGHVDMVKYVLSQKIVDINSRGKHGRTPLMVAAENGHRQVFDLLVTRGAGVSLVDQLRNNILHVACLGGHVDMAKYIVSQKVTDINSREQCGRTPLMVAAENGHRQVFDLLVTESADVTLVDDDGDNILHVTCVGGHVDMVKYVLSQKIADINSRGQYGGTPLMKAAEMGHRQVFDLLVTQGADVTLGDDDGDNILHVACVGGHVDIVKYVLSQKVADINSRGRYGRTPLMVAAGWRHRQVFDLLVTEGADVASVDDGGDNILHVACLGGHVDMVKYVLSQKIADINSRGQHGRTPLMVAAENGHRQVFDLLVTQGADVALVDDGRDNILHVACVGGHVGMVKYILSQKVADINSRGQFGWTPLMVAAGWRHRQVFDLLVTEGADVSLVDDNGSNILHVACHGGHVDMVKYVLSQKVVDINSRGKYGRTPLMVAAEEGQRQVFDLLVREGADVLLVDDNRSNILHVASLGGDADMGKHVQALNVVNIDDRNDHDDIVCGLMVATQGSSHV
ncbi:uncharacterized protein LOC124152553 [Haliotis rufescens]|uniref:uncharacterized protein LOC124152553 n=1 Tax=Haliotis rufescens TaxID=6454 RepID=UPI00201EC82C|nr:uncharacterized protein LOC124152553 [Haliotis rufescens]